MNICVFTPYRVGSQTFINTIRETHYKNHNVVSIYKAHGEDLVPSDSTHFILPLRNEIEIYPSAYFQDIMVPQYPYFLSDDPAVISGYTTSQLIEHFMSFDWNTYDHTNYDVYINYFKKQFDITICTKFDEPYCITTIGDKKIGLFKFNHMNNKDTISSFLRDMELCVDPSDIYTSNITCNERYVDFCKAIQKYKNCRTF